MLESSVVLCRHLAPRLATFNLHQCVSGWFSRSYQFLVCKVVPTFQAQRTRSSFNSDTRYKLLDLQIAGCSWLCISTQWSYWGESLQLFIMVIFVNHFCSEVTPTCASSSSWSVRFEERVCLYVPGWQLLSSPSWMCVQLDQAADTFWCSRVIFLNRVILMVRKWNISQLFDVLLIHSSWQIPFSRNWVSFLFV
jgi:hypothetical protein